MRVQPISQITARDDILTAALGENLESYTLHGPRKTELRFQKFSIIHMLALRLQL
jgi:hypothetical protein